MIHYPLFNRKPVFPVISDLHGHLVSARTEKELERHARRWKGNTGKTCSLIDFTGRDWLFSPDFPALSPMSMKHRRWTKKEIIELFNSSSLAQKAEMSYSTKSLSVKRLDRIINDIVELIETANQQQMSE